MSTVIARRRSRRSNPESTAGTRPSWIASPALAPRARNDGEVTLAVAMTVKWPSRSQWPASRGCVRIEPPHAPDLGRAHDRFRRPVPAWPDSV